MHELVIQNGRVALDDDWSECDIGIDGGRIAAIGARLHGKTTIDAAGKWVMPGGIDAHCHLDQPVWGGAGNADDFASGSISAAFGGTTCIVPFGMPGPDLTTIGAVDRAKARAAGKELEVCDQEPLCDTDTVVITVGEQPPVNQAPTAGARR